MASNYEAMAVLAAQRYGIDPQIFLRQIKQESGFNPNARSSAGAEGIAQFMPSTAAGMGINPMDPRQALFGAAKLDAGNLKKFGSWQEALAAYNAGGGHANEWNNPSFAGGQTYRYVRDILGGKNVSGTTGTSSTSPNAPGQPVPLPGPPQIPQLQQQLAAMLLSSTQGPNGTIAINSDPLASSQNLLALAEMRKQLQAAQQIYGPAPTMGSTTTVASPAQAGGPAVSNVPASAYSHIQFDPGVDWQHVNPKLLQTINQVAQQYGVTATINSGYRSNTHSASVGGFAGDPHTRGIAVDAYVGGKPIGAVIPASVWKRYGVMSGDVPNFYNGQPDPEHLQL